MATRSRIGIELKDGSILSAYHHWDGYPQWLGRILNTHYKTREQAADLIDGGDMSSCWTNERWGGVNEYGGQMKEETTEYGPQYYSQRGEDTPPRYDDDIFDFLKKENNEEYAYVWTVNNEWKCLDMHSFDDSKSPEVVEIPDGALAV